MKQQDPLRVVVISQKLLSDGITFVGDLPVEFLKTIANALNENYTVTTPKDRMFGNLLPDGSWNGLIGMISRSEVDVGIGMLTSTPERCQATRCTHPYNIDENTLLTPRTVLESDIKGFIKPFTLEVWLLIIGSLLLFSTVMATIGRVEGHIFKDVSENLFTSAFIWSLMILTQAGSNWQPKRDGGRIMVFVWSFASLILIVSYSGILTAMLTLPKVNIPINSISDLVNQEKVPWYLYEGAFLTDYFKESTYPVFRKVYDKMNGWTGGPCTAISKRILSGKIATFCHRTSIRRIVWNHYRKTGECPIYIPSTRELYGIQKSLMFSPNSTYYDKGNRIVDSLLDFGLIDKWFHKDIPPATGCFSHLSKIGDSNKVSPLDIQDLGGPFFILIGGYCIASLAFIMELAIRRRNT